MRCCRLITIHFPKGDTQAFGDHLKKVETVMVKR
jgi:hypothetical protein